MINFKSVDHALRWAFQISSTSIVKVSDFNSMHKPVSSGEMVQHAHAEVIIGMGERLLDVNELSWVMAKYGAALRGGECERRVADQLVRVVICESPTGVHSRRGNEKLVRIYFGQNISMNSVMVNLKCGHVEAYERRKAVHDSLDSLGKRAIDRMDTALREHMLIS